MIESPSIQQTLSAIEGGRRPTEDAGSVSRPDPEVVPRKTRRYLTASYKLKILDTVAELRRKGHGHVGEFLRKEGLYFSTVRKWEELQRTGTLVSTTRGPGSQSRESLLDENKKLRRKVEQLEKHLQRTEMIVEVQKKLSSLLGLELPVLPEESGAK